jgi:hypothetical protein
MVGNLSSVGEKNAPRRRGCWGTIAMMLLVTDYSTRCCLVQKASPWRFLLEGGDPKNIDNRG